MSKSGSRTPAVEKAGRPKRSRAREGPFRGGRARPLAASVTAHALLLIGATVLARPRFSVPEPIPSIPVTLVSLPAPSRGLMQRLHPAAPKEIVPLPREPKPAEKKLTPPKPPEPKQAETATQPVETPGDHSDASGTAKPEPNLPLKGSADSSNVIRTNLPAVGDLHGMMQMNIEGPVLPYSYYLGIIQDKIASYWEPSSALEPGEGEISAVIWFRIERDGSISAYHVEEPSGSNLFDTSALRALEQARPLPPLPEGYSGDHLIIHLRFIYSP